MPVITNVGKKGSVMKLFKCIFFIITLFLISGCLNTCRNSVATKTLQLDILSSIQKTYGVPGFKPLIMKCTPIGRHENGAYVESWNVKLYGVPGTKDFLISMKSDEKGETDYVVIPKFKMQKKK